MNHKLIIIFLILIILPSALAVNIKYTYTTVSSEVNAVVYKISDNLKFGDFSSGTTNYITINYDTDSPSTVYNTYHYKIGYLPYKLTTNLNLALNYPIKQSSCQAVATVVVPPSAQINTDFDVQLSFNKIFTDLDISSFPLELKDYYETSAEVSLYIDGDSVETKTVEILNTGDALKFTKQIATVGTRKIKIKTLVKDNQCQNKLEWTSLEYTIKIESPTTTTTPTTNQTTEGGCQQNSPQCPPNAAEKCTTGHPRCSCSTLIGHLCKEGEFCLPIYNLTHEDSGTCCSTICIPKPETCTTTLPVICDPDENGCAMYKECKDGYWTQCKRVDTTCIGGSSCSDGTPAGKCSLTNQGKLCINGELIINSVCITDITCQELWDCPSWVIIENTDTKFCSGDWVDMNHCNTYEYYPKNQSIILSINYESPYVQFQRTGIYDEGTFYGSSLSEIGTNPPDEQQNENIISSILNKVVGIPKDFNIKVGFELPILMLIIAIVIASFFIYAFTHKQPPKLIKPEKKQTKTSPVKVNDLLLSVIESLKGDERRIVDVLVEEEGITVEELRKKLGLTKTKMDIALQKLERRQIIKERKDYDSGLFFNDWMK